MKNYVLVVLALLILAFIFNKLAETANSGVLMLSSIEQILGRWINTNK
ncbi:hypothetical protein ACSQ6I_08270 [Anabaena sp. WFMT]